MRTITKETLNSIKMRVENKILKGNVLFSDYENMRDNILFLMKENSLLKEKLFELEQALPPDQQWENILSSKLELAFLENDSKEFLEINNSINNQTYTIIIQKKFGKTPAQLLDLSEIQRHKVIKKNIALQKHIDDLQKTCSYYKAEISVLLKLFNKPFLSEEDIESSQKVLEAAIFKTKELISKFNNNFIKYHGLKMHRSFQEAFNEGWRRANSAETEVSDLKVKVKQLKRVVLQKKYPYCRIYKGKLKRG